jgi:NAD-dependent dihydropyrimidine dehydrogenase PreA subunit
VAAELTFLMAKGATNTPSLRRGRSGARGHSPARASLQWETGGFVDHETDAVGFLGDSDYSNSGLGALCLCLCLWPWPWPLPLFVQPGNLARYAVTSCGSALRHLSQMDSGWRLVRDRGSRGGVIGACTAHLQNLAAAMCMRVSVCVCADIIPASTLRGQASLLPIQEGNTAVVHLQECHLDKSCQSSPRCSIARRSQRLQPSSRAPRSVRM